MLPSLPRGARFSPDHLWVQVAGDEAVIGPAPQLAGELGSIEGVTLPSLGSALSPGAPFARLQGTRGMLELLAPLAGEVLAVNGDLLEEPALAEDDPFGEGWLVRVSLDLAGEEEALMSADEYRDYLSGLDRPGEE